MNHYCYNWIEDWCRDNGWTDLFIQERKEYWAFPPNAVMPLPIPTQALKVIKSDKGLSSDEKRWCLIASVFAMASAMFSYLLQSPMPLVGAFAFCAIIVAQMEVED